MNDLYLELKKHLKENGVNVKWWCRKYLGDMHYHTIMAQFHGNNRMSEPVRRAVVDFLNEEKGV